MRTRRSRPWSAIPDDILMDRRLTVTARLVLAYCLGRPDGWRYRPEQICSAIGIGRDAWRAARRQLEQTGYLMQEQARDDSGKWVWDLVVTDTSASAGSAIDGQPVAGSAGDITDGNKAYGNSSSTARTRAHARAREEVPPSAAAAQQQQPGGKARRHRQSGIVTWTHDDVIEAERLEREVANEELAEAVAAVAEAGKEPVPGTVARELDRLRLRRQAAALAAARREAALAAVPPIEQAALERGRRFIESTRRRKEIENV